MIGFGELRRKAAEWQTELSTVEKVYALDWLLKGIYDRPRLAETLTLGGESALSKAHLASYPQVVDIDFVKSAELEDATLESELTEAIASAARESGLQFRLASFQSSDARVEFTGPLGRRSAAQPLIVLRFVQTQLRAAPVRLPLQHPFSDACVVGVRSISLEELAAQRLVFYGQAPRARDVFDLWFVVTHAPSGLDKDLTLKLAEEIAREKKLTLRTQMNQAHAALLAKNWDNALKDVRERPSFEAVRAQLDAWLAGIESSSA